MKFLNPKGRGNYGIGICDRCKFRFFLDELFDDIDNPGLKVCRKDRDNLSPYKLPQREPEDISLPFMRPEVGYPLDLTTPTVPPPTTTTPLPTQTQYAQDPNTGLWIIT